MGRPLCAPGWGAAAALACTLLLLASPLPAACVVSTLSTSVDGNSDRNTVAFFDATTFGFDVGGTVTVNVTCSGNLSFPITFVIFTGDQSEPFKYVRSVSVQPGQTSLNYSAGFGTGNLRTGFYKFALLLCAARNFPPPVRCDGELVLLNPGGEHLSSDMIALPGIYDSLLIFWLVLTAAHTLNWLWYFQYRNNLHDMAVLAPMLAAVSARLNRDGWEAESDDEPSTAKLKQATVASYAALCYCFLMLMFITYGYCILRPTFESWRAQPMVASVVLCFLSMVGMVYVHRYFLALTVILLVAIIVTIFKHSGKNLMILRARLLDIEAHTLPQLGAAADEFCAPLLSKRFMIAAARLIFVLYAVLWAIVGTLSSALKEQRDIQFLLEELLIVFLVVSILWVVRLRNFERFLQPLVDPRREREESAAPPSVAPCEVVELPGEKKYCLGVIVEHEQVHKFLRTLQRKRAKEARMRADAAESGNG